MGKTYKDSRKYTFKDADSRERKEKMKKLKKMDRQRKITRYNKEQFINEEI